jgi:NAD(P)H-binding
VLRIRSILAISEKKKCDGKEKLYLRASGLDYTIVRAPILTSAPAGQTNVRITQAVNRLTAGPKISRGDLARVMILASEQAVASRNDICCGD